MQSEIVKETDLFDAKGNLIQTGWAKRLLLNYNREKIRAKPIRIKEWDCYVILNPDFGLSLIVADVGYFGMGTVDWRDFKNNISQGDIALKFDTQGKMNLPRTADIGDVFFTEKKRWIKFERNKDTIPNRVLTFDFPKFKYEGHKGISGEITLYQDPKLDTMVNVIPFRNPKHFVYVQKIVCMPANGTVHLGGKTYEFLGEKNNSWCALDWSRGVFPVKTEWWWAFASGIVDGVHFGMNIDYGFGKNPSSKNMLFYDGQGHHLDKVTYTWDDKDLMKPWQFTSNDGRVELQLEPVHEHRLKMNVMLMYQEGTHVFGYYTGDVVLDDGTKIHIDRSDKLFGSAEYYDHGW
ncbi:MAG: DUF2804 domain-containing protein [Candidatus Hodarchaeota archaeon]